MASIIFDFPQPLGPTIAVRLLGNATVVGSTKDLNPANLIFSRRIISVLIGLIGKSIAFIGNIPITRQDGSLCYRGGEIKKPKYTLFYSERISRLFNVKARF